MQLQQKGKAIAQHKQDQSDLEKERYVASAAGRTSAAELGLRHELRVVLRVVLRACLPVFLAWLVLRGMRLSTDRQVDFRGFSGGAWAAPLFSSPVGITQCVMH